MNLRPHSLPGLMADLQLTPRQTVVSSKCAAQRGMAVNAPKSSNPIKFAANFKAVSLSAVSPYTPGIVTAGVCNDRIRIVGGSKLNGIIPISGAKNAALR